MKTGNPLTKNDYTLADGIPESLYKRQINKHPTHYKEIKNEEEAEEKKLEFEKRDRLRFITHYQKNSKIDPELAESLLRSHSHWLQHQPNPDDIDDRYDSGDYDRSFRHNPEMTDIQYQIIHYLTIDKKISLDKAIQLVGIPLTKNDNGLGFFTKFTNDCGIKRAHFLFDKLSKLMGKDNAIEEIFNLAKSTENPPLGLGNSTKLRKRVMDGLRKKLKISLQKIFDEQKRRITSHYAPSLDYCQQLLIAEKISDDKKAKNTVSIQCLPLS